MPISPHFNYFTYKGEQDLIESLVIESIRMYGIDVLYAPRVIKHKDDIFHSDSLSEYTSAYEIEMYVKNVEGFEGEGDFLSKFNIQIRDEITFVVARKVYDTIIGSIENHSRPREGDILYFPLTKKLYVVKFVEHEPVFYQNGALQMYDLRCELFEYSNEKLNTGREEIDSVEEAYSTDVSNLIDAQFDANGDLIIDQETGRPAGIDDYSIDDNDSFSNVIDYSEKNPFE